MDVPGSAWVKAAYSVPSRDTNSSPDDPILASSTSTMSMLSTACIHDVECACPWVHWSPAPGLVMWKYAFVVFSNLGVRQRERSERESSVHIVIRLFACSQKRYAQGPMAMDRGKNIERVAMVGKNFMFSFLRGLGRKVGERGGLVYKV